MVTSAEYSLENVINNHINKEMIKKTINVLGIFLVVFTKINLLQANEKWGNKKVGFLIIRKPTLTI